MIRVIPESKFRDSDDLTKYTVLNSLLYTNSEYIGILDKMTTEMGDKLLEAIRCVGNTDIQGLDVLNKMVTVGDKHIPIIELGTGESIFLLTEIAVQTQTPIAIIYFMKELSNKTLSKYLKRFMNDDIILIADADNDMLGIRVKRAREGLYD